MGNILMTGSGGGGAGSDDCTGTAAELLKGYTGILKGSDDEPVRGTLELTGNAQAAHVLNGETFYSNDAKTKHTGNMTVNSLLSFSVAAYSGRRVIATWTNPNQAAGRPYSGVIIRYDTGGYPGASGGVQIYKGAGNNHSAGAASQAFLDLPNLNTRYFLSCTPYVTTSIGELFGPTLNAEITTGGSTSRTFTASGSFVVEGFTKMDVFLVGGGGGAGYAGGGSGYTATQYGIPITTGNNVSVVVGGGGGPASNGGTSSISVNGAVKASAAGGNGAPDSYGVAAGYEQLLGLEVDVSKPDDFRQERIRAKISGVGTTTKEMVKNVASSYSNGEVEVIEDAAHYRFVIRFVGILGIPGNMADLKLTIEEIKPAHLVVEYEYIYNVWSDVEMLTWEQAAARTWEEIRSNRINGINRQI